MITRVVGGIHGTSQYVFLENSDGSTRGVYGSYKGTMLCRNGFIDEILQLRNLSAFYGLDSTICKRNYRS